MVGKRVRYSYWDALADVGGLHDGLSLIVKLLIAPLASTYFSHDLVRNSMKDRPQSYNHKERKRKLASNLLQGDQKVLLTSESVFTLTEAIK